MRVLSDTEVLRLWEAGLGQHPVDRALGILASALPDADPDRLAAMSVGRRDGYLMALREANFGSKVSGVVDCPDCHERLEWSLDVADVRGTVDAAEEGGPGRLSAEGYDLTYRLPDSTDLAAVARSGDPARGRDVLFRRCVLEAGRDGRRVDPRSLPESVVSELAAEMERRDAQAEILLDFSCPTCGLRWRALLDVLTFLWAELCGRARHLLNEVHLLARAYGWTEEDILKMSLARRRFYLEAAT